MKVEKVIQRRGVDIAGHFSRGQQRLDLRPEYQPLVVQCVVQRLDAKGVARQQDRLRFEIENGKGEHAVQGVDHLRAAFLVQVQQHFRVGARAELVTLAQIGVQFAKIVDLAIEDHPTRAVLVAHRLMAGRRQIDDRQSPKCQPRRPKNLDTLVVWAAVADRIGHAAQHVAIGLAPGIAMHDAADSTHRYEINQSNSESRR